MGSLDAAALFIIYEMSIWTGRYDEAFFEATFEPV